MTHEGRNQPEWSIVKAVGQQLGSKEWNKPNYQKYTLVKVCVGPITQIYYSYVISYYLNSILCL